MNFQNDAILRLLQSELDASSDGCTGEGRGAGTPCRSGDGDGTVSRRGCGNACGRGCGCGEKNGTATCLSGSSLAMVYAPRQDFANLYEPEEGLCHGTIFQELEKPFHGGRGK